MKRLLFAAVLLLGGCNAYDAFYEEGASNDPDVLLEDALFALQAGDADRAVTYLEKAYERDPDNAAVRVELAGALLEANGVDVITLKEVADFISERAEQAAGKGAAAQCNFSFEAFPEAEEFDFFTSDAYRQLVENLGALQRVAELVLNLSDEQMDRLGINRRAKRLLLLGFAELSATIVEVQQTAASAGVTLYQLTDERFGMCADTALSLDDFEQLVKCEVTPKMERGVGFLEQRETLLGRGLERTGSSTTADEIIDAANEAIDTINAEVTAVCTAG